MLEKTLESPLDCKKIKPVNHKMKSLSRVRLFATPCTVAYQAPPSMGFSKQEYWSGLPFPSPGDLLNTGIELRDQTPVSRIVGRRFTRWATREALKPRVNQKYKLELVWGTQNWGQDYEVVCKHLT